MTELPRDLPEDAAAPPQHGMSTPRPQSAQHETFAGGDMARVTAWVRGRVQGVGFRWWTRSHALELGLAGWARNLEDGRVEVVAEGPRRACEALVAQIGGPPGRGRPGSVDGVTERWSDPPSGRPPLAGFVER